MIFGRIGRIFRSVARIAIGAGIGFLTGGPLGAFMAPFKEVLGKVLDKLPFAKFLKPALSFLGGGGPLSFLSKGPLGLISSLASKAGNLGNLSSLARGLLGNVGGHQNVDPAGILNMAKIFASNHARLL